MSEQDWRPAAKRPLLACGSLRGCRFNLGANAAWRLALDQPAKRSPTGLAAAGCASALISIPFKDNVLILGAIFGTVLVVYFALFKGMRTPVRFFVFIMVCSAAYPLSILAVMFNGLTASASLDVTLAQFSVGGGVGAFIVLLAGMLLFGPAEMRGDTLGLALFGSFGGGILGLLGGELDRAIGLPKVGNFDSPVFLVWQSGVALILGVLLKWGRKRYVSATQTPTK